MDALHETPAGILLEQLQPDGSFSREQLKLTRKLGLQRKVVMLAFPPKAAGTFLRSAIIRAIDGQLVRVVHALGGRDATPYMPIFLDYYQGGVTEKTLVSHVHMLGLPANLRFLSAFAIRPIVIKRNIPDMLASYWDMLETDGEALRHGLNCRIPEHFRTLTHNAKADFVVDILGPWYVNYYAGWLEHAQSDAASVCVIGFRELCSDPARVLQRCLEFAGLPRSHEICEEAVIYSWDRRQALRFNRGVEGRGQAYLRSAHLNRLARMAGHYPVLEPHRADLLETAPVASARRAMKRV